MGTPNLFSYFALSVFVLFELVAFATMRAPLAAVVLVVFGEMFLPWAAAFDLPVFLRIERAEILYIGVPASTLIFPASGLRDACPGRLAEVQAGRGASRIASSAARTARGAAATHRSTAPHPRNWFVRQRYMVVTPAREEEQSIELRMGELDHFPGYRWLYMLVRSLRSAVQGFSRGTGGVALLLADLRAALRRAPRFDADHGAWVRKQQLARFNRSHLCGYLAATRCRSNV